MTVAIAVYCYPVDRNSAYVPLLFMGIEDRYLPIYRQESLRDALADLDAGREVIVHVHWEEFALRDCASEAEANVAAAAFVARIDDVRRRRGPFVWTVHNEWPHEIPYRRAFLAMRAALARHADVVLAHNAVSIDAVAAQVALDRTHVRMLAHPSYLGRHEDDAALLAGLARPRDRCVQCFGWIRRQKGFAETIRMVPRTYLSSRGAYVRVSGDGPEAAAVIAEVPDRTDVVWDVRHVPHAEVAALLRSAACVLLPYERVLTSGVALLAISVGALLVAVDTPQLRELLPAANHRWLYPRGDERALRRVLDDAFALSEPERRAIVLANLSVARALHPTIVAERLAGIYDEVRARGDAAMR